MLICVVEVIIEISWVEATRLGLLILNRLVMPLVLFQFSLWKKQGKLELRQDIFEERINNIPGQKAHEKLLVSIEEIKGEIKANRKESAANFNNLDKHIDKITTTLERHEDYANTGGGKNGT